MTRQRRHIRRSKYDRKFVAGKRLLFQNKDEELGMGVYDKYTNKLEDFGKYKSRKEARKDFLNWDKPRGRYAILDDGTRWD